MRVLKMRLRYVWWDIKTLSPYFALLGFFAALIAAWVTHAFWLVVTLASPAGATAGQVILGILGVFVPPFGVIHGIAIWLGVGA